MNNKLYHLNPDTGNINECEAKTPQECRFGQCNCDYNINNLLIKADFINKQNILKFPNFQKTDNNIYFLYFYYPKRFIEEHKGISEDIIKFIVNKFTFILKQELLKSVNNNITKFKNTCLVVMPSHSQNNWSNSLLKMSNTLCNDLQLENYSFLLQRFKEHDKLAFGGDRNIKSHLSTIRINLNHNYNINNKSIIILDDVTTTGNSLLAAQEILKQYDIKKIYLLALSKTIKQ